MNRFIGEDIIAEIRSRLSIVDLVGSYVPLKRSGNGVYKALCPFHNEKTPSFTVNEAKQIFHCFGCGKGGDIFRFVMEKEDIDFPNAAHILAGQCGVIIPENNNPAEAKKNAERADLRERIYRINEDFANFFQNSLFDPKNQSALQYLKDRGLTDEVIKKFRLGYSPNDFDGSLKHGKAGGFSDEELVLAGIIRRNDAGKLYNLFRGRLTFAIWNETGKVVGFSARIMEKNPNLPKYVNTPDTPVFKKGSLLYALPIARSFITRENRVILCEGQLDVIAMHRAGFGCTVAPQGTGFTAGQAQLLRNYTDHALLGFDSDNAGQEAILRAFPHLLPLDFDIKIIRFPGGKDPDELFKNSGKTAIEAAVNNSIDWLEFLNESLRRRFDFNNPGDLNQALDEFFKYLQLIRSAASKELYFEKAIELFKVSRGAMMSVFRNRKNAKINQYNALGSTKSTVAVTSNSDKSELLLFEIAFNFETHARHLSDILPTKYLSASPGASALNAVLQCTVNEEFSERGRLISELLCDITEPELSRIMIEDTKISENNIEKIINDCIFDLKQKFISREKNRIFSALSQPLTPDEKIKLLNELTELK